MVTTIGRLGHCCGFAVLLLTSQWAVCVVVLFHLALTLLSLPCLAFRIAHETTHTQTLACTA